ncbi:MAG TPA: 1-deoxy-D-xylulose-5-phosphate reductoisomerase [Acidimicrobiales bacterium]|nr:1-deoxy-D-xylulose-5-phosphate reductoisomerase [Acidimicrobiales bacterium]
MTEVTVSLLGSTGSIGRQTLDVIAAAGDRFRVVALGASGQRLDELDAQIDAVRPEAVVVADPAAAAVLRERRPSLEVLEGADGLAELATRADVVMNAVVGFAGLPVTLAALGAGRRLALANKESLIAAGPVVQRARVTPGAELVPVDSEHSAIHQCLHASGTGGAASLRRLLLTASGGPFRGRTRDELEQVTVDDALAHPTWRMGPKVTIDSSTLVNKGLEVIEAHELFDVPVDVVDVVVHPQSIIHSMVEFVDGATIAQLSQPDMRLPIGYALNYPERLGAPFGALDWDALSRLDFERPDEKVFKGLALAYAAGRTGGTAPAWFNAANEIAVEAFLGGRIAWLSIADVIDETLDASTVVDPSTVDDVLAADSDARARATLAVDRRAA